MSMYYHQTESGEVAGPVTVAAIRRLVEAGSLHDDSLLMRHGDEDWLPLSAWGDRFRGECVTPASLHEHPQVQATSVPARGGEIFEPVYETRVPGLVLFLAGLCVMVFFLIGYETAVEGGGRAVNNFGLMSMRDSGVNAGGFLMVAGAVLVAGGGGWRRVS